MNIEENLGYYLILFFSALIASAYFVLVLLFARRSIAKSLPLILLIVLSVSVSLLLTSLYLKLLYTKEMYSYSFIPSEFYITLVMFYIQIMLIGQIYPRLRSEYDLILASLLIFAFLSRFACIYSGCCSDIIINGRKVQINVYMEMLFALVFVLINSKSLGATIKKRLELLNDSNAQSTSAISKTNGDEAIVINSSTKLTNLTTYVLTYSIFRFIIEYFKYTGFYRHIYLTDGYFIGTFNYVTFRQILALAVIIGITCCYYINKLVIKKQNA